MTLIRRSRMEVKSLHSSLRSRYFATTAPTARGCGHPISPSLSTLDHAKLLPSDFVDMSNKIKHTIHFAGMPPPLRSHFLFWGGASNRFPDHARGFLYLHNPFNQPSIASSIRFRCSHSNDPAAFNQGKDLADPKGMPWHLGLPRILNIRTSCIRDYLLHARIITNEQMTHWRHVIEQSGRTIRHAVADRNIIHRLDQPFRVKFHKRYEIRVATRDFVGLADCYPVYGDYRSRFGGRAMPYRGSAIVRFELSTLPEHSERRGVVMRVLKLLEPVVCAIPNYDGWLSPPQEGGLVCRDGKPKTFWDDTKNENGVYSRCFRELVEAN